MSMTSRREESQGCELHPIASAKMLGRFRRRRRLTWRSMTPVNITAVITLSFARSLTAVVRPGKRGCFSKLGGSGDGIIVIAIARQSDSLVHMLGRGATCLDEFRAPSLQISHLILTRKATSSSHIKATETNTHSGRPRQSDYK